MRLVFVFFVLFVLSVSAADKDTKKVTQTVCWNQCGRADVAKNCNIKEFFEDCKKKCPTLPKPCEEEWKKSDQNKNDSGNPSPGVEKDK